MTRKPSRTRSRHEKVPGPTENPATNLMMADIALRTGSYLMRNLVERKILGKRYGKVDAKQIIANRSVKQTVASVLVSKVATKSVPGAVLVGSGLIVKTLFDRSQKRRKAKRAGDRTLLERTETE